MADRPAAGPAAAPARRARQVVAAVVAVGVVGAALAVILLLGRVSPPAFPSLAASPDPTVPGRVAYVDTGDGEPACVHLVDAGGGAATTLTCLDGVDVSALTWPVAERLELTGFDDLGTLEMTLSAADGTVLERRRPQVTDRPTRAPLHPCEEGAKAEDGSVVLAGGGFGDDRPATLVLVDPDGRERVLLQLPERQRSGRGYRLMCPQLAPDGDWVLVQDDAGRLLLVGVATGEARVLAEDVRHAAWAPRT